MAIEPNTDQIPEIHKENWVVKTVALWNSYLFSLLLIIKNAAAMITAITRLSRNSTMMTTYGLLSYWQKILQSKTVKYHTQWSKWELAVLCHRLCDLGHMPLHLWSSSKIKTFAVLLSSHISSPLSHNHRERIDMFSFILETGLSVSSYKSHLIIPIVLWGKYFSPILKIRKLKLREVKWFAQHNSWSIYL